MQVTEEDVSQQEIMRPHRLAAVLAEYASLRAEIAGRSRDQLVCVTGSLVTTGAVLSTVASDPSKYSGLLVIAPWLLTVFGLLWCDHAQAVHFIGKYIREKLEKERVLSLLRTSDTTYLGWETYIAEKRDTTRLLGFVNVALPMLYFAAPSLVITAAYFLIKSHSSTTLPPELEVSFVTIGGALFFAFVVSWRRVRRLAL